jgi:uncharacterized protein (TIGR01777 family)
MKIVVTGSSGFVGRWLVPDLESAGHDVVRLVRRAPLEDRPYEKPWDPKVGVLPSEILVGVDAVVNLAGRSIADGRWSKKVKAELRSSRVCSTRLLVKTMAKMDAPPRILISASATGIYGSRGGEDLMEDSPLGYGFLADLARDWEREATAAEQFGTQVVLLRLGVIVGRGGALAKMLRPFRLGVGGPIGNGRQWWPWVAMEDVIGVIRFALENTTVKGPLNVVSPHSETSRAFAKKLGQVLHRPAVLPLPASAARLALGEMADALLLSSAKVQPAALERLEYPFRTPDLSEALRTALD